MENVENPSFKFLIESNLIQLVIQLCKANSKRHLFYHYYYIHLWMILPRAWYEKIKLNSIYWWMNYANGISKLFKRYEYWQIFGF